MNISSYPTVFAIGHAMIGELLKSPVVVEEKIDGSQFSFALIDGELTCRSKGKTLVIDAPEKMFARAVETVKRLDLRPGWVYRAEYLEKPKHNTLAYSRVPAGHLMVFDVATGMESYLSPTERAVEANRIGLESVPVLHVGAVESASMFNQLLERESVLGGCQIEGVVVKNYGLFTAEKKIAIGKYVSEAFKEKHESDWKGRNPGRKDIVASLIDTYRTDARYQKALQHLRDDGKIEGSARDIGALIREVPDDILKECEQEIRDALFKHFWGEVRRGIVAGIPTWYKQVLLAKAFDDNNAE